MQFNGNQLGVSYEGRESMITLLEALNTQKKYKLDTLYLALSLCDRYLVNLAIQNVSAPSLITLAVAATLMAAKLEEPVQPNYGRMVRLVMNQWDVQITKQDLIDLEERIIKSLDFDLHFAGPLLFLERFQRVFDLDCGSETAVDSKNSAAFMVSVLAHSLIRMVIRTPAYLTLKPSQVAAGAFTLALNLCVSRQASELNLEPISSLKFRILDSGHMINYSAERNK